MGTCTIVLGNCYQERCLNLKYGFGSHQHKVVVEVLGIGAITQGACRMGKEGQEWTVRKTAMEGGAGRDNEMDQED